MFYSVVHGPRNMHFPKTPQAILIQTSGSSEWNHLWVIHQGSVKALLNPMVHCVPKECRTMEMGRTHGEWYGNILSQQDLSGREIHLAEIHGYNGMECESINQMLISGS